MWIEILKAAAARKILSVSHGRFFELRKLGLVPEAVQISSRSVGYPSDELQAVARARVAGWSDQQIADLVVEMAAKRQEAALQAIGIVGTVQQPAAADHDGRCESGIAAPSKAA